MARKKHRQKHQGFPGDTSDDEAAGNPSAAGGDCPHAAKAVNVTHIKQVMKNGFPLGTCQKCSVTDKDGSERDVDDSVWICLQCGHRGCGRLSPEKHALLHYRTPHSDCHSYVLNSVSWSLWCYECDREVFPEKSHRLIECVDFIRKRAVGPSAPTVGSSGRVSKDLQNGDEPCARLSENAPAKSCDPSKETVEQTRADVLQISKGVVEKDTVVKNKNGLVLSVPKVKGLSNLGNTCFFNAVLQNLSQTSCLTAMLEERSGKGTAWQIPSLATSGKDDPQELQLELVEAGPLTCALMTFFRDMVPGSSSKNGIIVPKQIFGQICKKSPQFQGFRQQDSHELLRHLLDGVRTEEIKRQKSAILRMFHLSEKVNPRDVDEETRSKIKVYAKQASHTLVDSIFGGQLLSTVLCEECHMSSQVFEPFMDLSLPVQEERPARPGQQRRPSVEETPFDSPSPVRGQRKERQDKPNKYQERKLKKQAKRDAKKKAKASRASGGGKMLSPSSFQAEKPEGEETAEEASGGEQADDEGSEIRSGRHSRASLDASEAVDGDCHRSDLQAGEEPPFAEAAALAESNSPLATPDDERPLAGEKDISGDGLEAVCSRIGLLSVRKTVSTDSLLETAAEGRTPGDPEPNPAGGLVESAGSTDSGIGNGEKGDAAEVDWSKKVKQEWIARSLTTLAPRYQPTAHECSVASCLHQFTAPELLAGNNKFGCENCARLKSQREGVGREGERPSVMYSNASKQLLIFTPPAILTLHLKRFQQVGVSLRKVNRFVEFPLLLDLAPFCSSIYMGAPRPRGGRSRIMYSLYGVVEHSGRLSGGHYTAKVKVRSADDGRGRSFLNLQPASQDEVDSMLRGMADGIRGERPRVDDGVAGDDPSAEVPPGRWFHVSDGHVSEVDEHAVLKSQAYLLFYERIL